mmetsp:Transcript_27463/g.59158  ORF Transcript_27463/g.59158 Transcript_27463/m.59158 type:complete len:260 (+) Transcript_27463:239-1018(+)
MPCAYAHSRQPGGSARPHTRCAQLHPHRLPYQRPGGYGRADQIQPVRNSGASGLPRCRGGRPECGRQWGPHGARWVPQQHPWQRRTGGGRVPSGPKNRAPVAAGLWGHQPGRLLGPVRLNCRPGGGLLANQRQFRVRAEGQRGLLCGGGEAAGGAVRAGGGAGGVRGEDGADADRDSGTHRRPLAGTRAPRSIRLWSESERYSPGPCPKGGRAGVPAECVGHHPGRAGQRVLHRAHRQGLEERCLPIPQRSHPGLLRLL